MESDLEKIIEKQRAVWNKSSRGWKKWDEKVMDFLRPMNDELIRMINLRESDVVLDVATGTGEPALTMATLLKKGKVVGVDLAEDMLAVAREKAERQGIRNFETVCCDVSSLPFGDEMFDSITCRLGFNLFPDIQIALREMLRVLKPGGRISASVWGLPSRNSWVCSSMETMISKLGLTPAAPGEPSMFRCSESGYLSEHFGRAGLKNIKEISHEGRLSFESFETYWNFISEVASPVVFAEADESLKLEIRNEVLNKVRQTNPTEKIELDSHSYVTYGEK